MLALAMPALATALKAFNTGYDAPMLSHPKASSSRLTMLWIAAYRLLSEEARDMVRELLAATAAAMKRDPDAEH